MYSDLIYIKGYQKLKMKENEQKPETHPTDAIYPRDRQTQTGSAPNLHNKQNTTRKLL